MRLASTTINWNRLLFTLLISLIFFLPSALKAQENSPYSRYGLGDLLPTQNIVNRGMGGVSIAYYDLQSVNFVNPASYSRLRVTTFDVGLEYDSRTLKSSNPPVNFKSAYLIPSYVQLAVPLNKKGTWGLNFGLRPLTRINYNVVDRTRIPDIDSVNYQFEGNGGTYQVYAGTGFGFKNLRIGFNVGYMFGNKNYSTRVVFVNDTVSYKKSNSTDSTDYGAVFVNGGIQYTFRIGNQYALRLGVNGSLENKLNATRNITRETFEFSPTTGTATLDSIYKVSGQEGTIIYPASYGAGFIIEKEDKWMLGVDYSITQWDNYKYYNEADRVKSNWELRLGGQFTPDFNGKSYWSRVTYRAGLRYGPDYIDLDKELNQYAFTFGAGFPVRRNVYTNQYTTINMAFEIGARGNKSNAFRESLFKLAIGFNLSDIWFNKPKYD